jgi:hypothetical protein
MKYMATWSIQQDKWLALCKRFGSMSPEERGNACDRVKIIGRWGDPAQQRNNPLSASAALQLVRT